MSIKSLDSGICGLVYYQHWLHPWRHIIATEPRFKLVEPSSYSAKFIAGTLVASVFLVGDLLLLAMISLKSYPDDVLKGVVYFVFPYIVSVVSLFYFGLFLIFSPMKVSDNLKLKAIGRPNFILSGLINGYKISGIQGSILVGILKFYRKDLNDGMLDLYIGLYIACVLLGVLTTVGLYMDSSLKRKLQKRLGQLNSVAEIWREAKNDILWVNQRDFSLARHRPRPVYDFTPPQTPPDLPERKPGLSEPPQPRPITPKKDQPPKIPPPRPPLDNYRQNAGPPPKAKSPALPKRPVLRKGAAVPKGSHPPKGQQQSKVSQPPKVNLPPAKVSAKRYHLSPPRMGPTNPMSQPPAGPPPPPPGPRGQHGRSHKAPHHHPSPHR